MHKITSRLEEWRVLKSHILAIRIVLITIILAAALVLARGGTGRFASRLRFILSGVITILCFKEFANGGLGTIERATRGADGDVELGCNPFEVGLYSGFIESVYYTSMFFPDGIYLMTCTCDRCDMSLR